MITTDPIADMLTRIRNGLHAGHGSVTLPYSKIKFGLAEILKSQGYVKSVAKVKNGAFDSLAIELTGADKRITAITRVSKPGRRMYTPKSEIPLVLGGRGIVILSTPQGLMTGREAHKKGIGGELLCEVY